MKAKEWVATLQRVPESELPVEEKFVDFIKDFAEETQQLVTIRTKFSKPESKFSASEGAVKEQRNKFQSICKLFPSLTIDLFDFIVEKAIPGWKQMVEAQQKKEQQEKLAAEKSFRNDGRKFANKKKDRMRFGT